MRGTLRQIEPIIAPEKTPDGAIQVGVTPDGLHALWKRVRTMVKAEPEFDADGERVWLRNKNGDRVVPKNKKIVFKETQLFYTEPGVNNERYEIPYVEPTEAQKKAAERQRLVKELGGNRLAELIVDAAAKAGKTPDEIVMGMMAGNTQQVADTEFSPADLQNMGVPSEAAGTGELQHIGGPHWLLGNGQKFKGSREDAEAAQAALDDSDGQPEPIF